VVSEEPAWLPELPSSEERAERRDDNGESAALEAADWLCALAPEAAVEDVCWLSELLGV